jgi:hypothetical protein
MRERRAEEKVEETLGGGVVSSSKEGSRPKMKRGLGVLSSRWRGSEREK